MPQAVNPLYGQASESQSRYQIAGDARKMYPVSSVGGMFSRSTVPGRIAQGSAYEYCASVNPPVFTLGGVWNCLPSDTGVFPFGDPVAVDGTTVAVRLGVTGTTGGNVFLIGDPVPGDVIANNVLNGLTQRWTVMMYGEAAYQDTNATSSQYGASIEQFLNNVAGTVTVGSGSQAVVGVGTTFTTAALGGAAGPYTAIYHGPVTSSNTMTPGDLILITLDSGSKSWHRVYSVTDDTHLTIYPAAPSAATGKAYSLWRSGWGSWSRVVTILNGTTAYNYYSGLSVGASIGGPIMCFTKNMLTGASSHFTCPETSSGGANIATLNAVDIAYYKGFLLYGLNGSVSWSVAGFPTDFTVGFGADDFPSTNITVVDNEDTFVSFEYIGDQLIAIFRNSVWQIQATGTVPEFQFYRLPEAYGCLQVRKGLSLQVQNASIYSRPSISARNCAFYLSPGGLVKLAGGVGNIVSDAVEELLFRISTNIGATHIGWDQSSDTIFVGASNSSSGILYRVPRDEWGAFNFGNFAGSAGLAHPSGSQTLPADGRISLASYDQLLEKVYWIDQNRPFSPGPTTTAATLWIWSSPVISLGDDYDGFRVSGFQFEGAETGVNFTVYAGRSPYQMASVDTGTITGLNNRVLFSKKIAYPFIAISINGIYRSVVGGVNLYAEGQGL